MTKHEDIERLIQKSLDREINAEEEKVLHHHISACDDCRTLYSELTQFIEEMDERIEFFPSPDFNDRVLRKLGLRKSLAWSKVAAVFAAGWTASLLFLLFSPWPRELLTKTLVSTPTIVRFFDKVQLIISAFSHIVTPFARGLFNPVLPALGLILSVILFYLFGKSVRKETKCTV